MSNRPRRTVAALIGAVVLSFLGAVTTAAPASAGLCCISPPPTNPPPPPIKTL